MKQYVLSIYQPDGDLSATEVLENLGAAFAEMEMRALLRCVLRTRTLTAASANAERPTRRNVTLSPRDGTRVIISRRATGSAQPGPQ
jgi:hypothetical protein